MVAASKGRDLGDQWAAFERALAGHGADLAGRRWTRVDVGQVGHAVEVDQGGGLGQAKVHGRDQALAAGEEFAVIGVFGEQIERLLRGWWGRGIGMVLVSCRHSCQWRHVGQREHGHAHVPEDPHEGVAGGPHKSMPATRDGHVPAGRQVARRVRAIGRMAHTANNRWAHAIIPRRSTQRRGRRRLRRRRISTGRRRG